MLATTTAKSSIAAQWRAARRLYPIYTAIATQFGLGAPPFESLGAVGDSESEILNRVEKWLAEMDGRIEAHQFRQILQTSFLATSEDKLNALIERHLRKEPKAEADRDKLAFLLVQYFALCAPPSFHERVVSLEEVAEVLEPVLGECAPFIPSWLQPMEELIAAMRQCASLRELDENRVIDRGRQLRTEVGDSYFTANSLLAFTYFGYLVRRTCYELMQVDLKAIEDGLAVLENQGVAVVDCRGAELSDHEPLDSVRQICRNWHRSVTPDYSQDKSFGRLLQLRAAVDKAVTVALQPITLEEAAAAQRRLERRVHELAAEVAELRRQVSELKGEAPPSAAAEVVESEPSADHSTAASGPGAAGPATVSSAPGIPSAPSPAKAPSDDGYSLEQAERLAAGEMEACITRMKEMFSTKKVSGAASIAVGGTKLLLTPFEVGAFLNKSDPQSALIQKAAASRVLLVDAMEEYKRTRQRSPLKLRLPGAKATADEVQALIATLRQARKTEEAENFASLARQLTAIVQQADRMAGPL
jgi:hypothetical protein